MVRVEKKQWRRGKKRILKKANLKLWIEILQTNGETLKTYCEASTIQPQTRIRMRIAGLILFQSTGITRLVVSFNWRKKRFSGTKKRVYFNWNRKGEKWTGDRISIQRDLTIFDHTKENLEHIQRSGGKIDEFAESTLEALLDFLFLEKKRDWKCLVTSTFWMNNQLADGPHYIPLWFKRNGSCDSWTRYNVVLKSETKLNYPEPVAPERLLLVPLCHWSTP